MDLSQIPLFAILKGKLGYLNDRQKLIAQNVANADTPGYAPSDLKPFTLETHMAATGGGSGSGGGITPVVTNPGHMTAPNAPQVSWASQTSPDSEARLDGNQVVLEDQMLKMNQAKQDYDAAIGLYEQSLSMLRMAASKPGG